MTGSIKHLKSEKFFGFIHGEDNRDYFFHKDDMVEKNNFKNLSVGSVVTFDPTDSSKGPRASYVES